MKVIQLINGLDYGGGERLLVDLVRGLRPPAFDVRVYCLTREGPLADELRALGVPVRRLTWVGLPDPRALISLAADLQRADLVHSHFFYSDLLGRLLGYVWPVRRLSTRHDLGSWMSNLHRAVEPWIYSGCERVICVSEAVAESLRRRAAACGLLVTVLPDIATPPAGPPPALPRPYVLSVGRLAYVKGHDLLLEAFATLVDDGSADGVTLVLAGDGPERRSLERRAARLQIADRCRFLGAMPPVHVAALQRHAALFVLPSRAEAAGLSLLEAMAVGRACVATRVGGVPEVVEDGVTGLLVKPDSPPALANAIRALLCDPDRAVAFGTAAQRVAEERFGGRRFVDRVRALYSTHPSADGASSTP